MSLDLSSYKVASGETSSSTKYDNAIQAIQDALNAIGDTSKTAWAAGQIIDPNQIKQSGASSSQVLAWNGSAWAPANAAAGTTYRKTTAKTVNNTVSETDLLNGEITIGAGVLGTTGVARLTALGDWLNNAGTLAPPRFKVKLGGTTILDTGTSGGTFSATANRGGWKAVVDIHNMGAANSQIVNLELDLTSSGSAGSIAGTFFTTGNGIYMNGPSTSTLTVFAKAEGNNTATVDTSASKLLELTVINGTASVNYETKLFAALVQVL